MARNERLTVPMTNRLPDFKLKQIQAFFTRQEERALTSEFCMLTSAHRYASEVDFKAALFLPCDEAEERDIKRRNHVKKWMREFKRKQLAAKNK